MLGDADFGCVHHLVFLYRAQAKEAGNQKTGFGINGGKAVVLTGVGYEKGYTGVVTYENGEYLYYKHQLMPNGCHGTGDIYASGFVGALVKGKTLYDASVVAAEFTLLAIKETAKYDNHWYGAKFEPVLYKLNSLING